MRLTYILGVVGALVAGTASATPVPYTDTTPGAAVFTAPVDGLYQITAIGAEGGNGNSAGGLGAQIIGDFNILAGQTLSIIVGGMGGTNSGGGGAGGGGTFVAFGNTAWIVAGGGAGGSLFANGGNATLTGSSGTGQGGNGGDCCGGGGGGFLTNGGGTFNATGGASFLNGGAGGNGTSRTGGVGGGGGSTNSGGGGGGYTGGDGTGDIHSSATGGSSFFAGLADANFSESVLSSAVNSGNGELIVTLLSETPTDVPEPASIALLAMGLAGITAMGRRRA